EDPTRDEVVELAMRRELAHLTGGEIPDHRRVGEHELIARTGVLALAPPAPECLRMSGAEALGRAGLLHRLTSAGTTGDGTPFSSGPLERAVIPRMRDFPARTRPAGTCRGDSPQAMSAADLACRDRARGLSPRHVTSGRGPSRHVQGLIPKTC